MLLLMAFAVLAIGVRAQNPEGWQVSYPGHFQRVFKTYSSAPVHEASVAEPKIAEVSQLPKVVKTVGLFGSRETAYCYLQFPARFQRQGTATEIVFTPLTELCEPNFEAECSRVPRITEAIAIIRLERAADSNRNFKLWLGDRDAEIPDLTEVTFHPLRGSSVDYLPGVAFTSFAAPLLQENVQPGVYYAPFHRLIGRDACSLDVFADLEETPEFFAMTLLLVGH